VRAATLWLCLLVVAVAALPSVALADGDPASDTLPSADAYLPVQPQPSPAGTARLAGLLKAARASGHPVKVAVIASPTDLGSVPVLFGKPDQYARFLAGEIRAFLPAGATLIVAMPSGLGAAGPGATAAVHAAVTRLRSPANADSDSLTNVAGQAIRATASAGGHPLPASVASAAGGTNAGRIVFVAVLALMLLLGSAAAARMRWQRACVAG